VRSLVLLSAIREISDNAFDILSGWHQQIERLELLRGTVAVDRFND
jgi:hypothetical protein